MPSPGDLAILFQTIVGALPLNLTTDDGDALAVYAKRVAAWQQKALREAKLHSDWSVPNAAYEQAASDFIAWLFSGPSELFERDRGVRKADRSGRRRQRLGPDAAQAHGARRA